MGIVNVTPDSFSDGGEFLDPEVAIKHALQLVADGADILDIGGESTRPYAEPVSVHDELQRVLPVVEALAAAVTIPLSIDTSKAIVAEAALSFGVEIINDVTGLTGDPAMLALAAQWEVGVCAMHMQGTPQTMQDAPRMKMLSTKSLNTSRLAATCCLRQELHASESASILASVLAKRISTT